MMGNFTLSMIFYFCSLVMLIISIIKYDPNDFTYPIVTLLFAILGSQYNIMVQLEQK